MIRKGPYKLMHFFEDDSIRLYNIDEDRGEQTDLAKTQPELTLLAVVVAGNALGSSCRI